MIKAVGNKKIDLSKEEYSYFLSLKDVFGESSFIGLFETNDDGDITLIKPALDNPTSMAVIFFLLNVMLNQRLRKLDKKIKKIDSIESRIKTLEEGINNGIA